MNPELSCNCDVSAGKWLSDEGYYESPDSLGVMKMVFIQQKDLEDDAQGRITLGPLECVETSIIFLMKQQFSETKINKKI